MGQHFSTQEILKRCFNSATGRLTVTNTYDIQDYFNAIFDAENNSLRIAVDGVVTGETPSGEVLPEVTAEDNDKVLTVINGAWAKVFPTTELPIVTVDDNNKILTVVNGNWEKTDLPMIAGSPYAIESLHALPEAIVGNLGKTVFYTGPTENGLYKNSFYVLEAVGVEPTITYEWMAYGVANSSISVKQEILTLPPEDPPNPVLIDVQGNIQDIDDENNADNVIATHYRIDFSGYILSMENYESEEAALTDRYYGKMSYNSDNNITNIFMTVEEYAVMSSFTAGKNILKINYLENPEVSIGNTVSDGASTLPVVTVADNDKVLTVVNGNWETATVPLKGEETLTELTGTAVSVAPWTQSKWSASGTCTLTATGWAASGRQTAYIVITLAAGSTPSIIGTEAVEDGDALSAAGVYECFLKNVDGKIYFHQISFTEAAS